jgi:hypothetical protein
VVKAVTAHLMSGGMLCVFGITGPVAPVNSMRAVYSDNGRKGVSEGWEKISQGAMADNQMTYLST